MTGTARIAAFTAGVAALAAVAALVGRAADIAPRSVESASDHADGQAMDESAPVGLSLSEDGLVLVPDVADLSVGASQQLAFRIDGPMGEPVTAFDVEHEKLMHVILVRRDLSGFQHLHPAMRPDGTWETSIRLAEPGAYRLFADFSTGGVRRVLGADLLVAGSSTRRPLPPPARSVDVGSRRVHLTVDGGELDSETRFRFTVERDGTPVELDPYLGARGHLVVLREGDLAYVHAHAEVGSDSPEIVFESMLPSPGRYALYLQVSDGGEIVTAPFTLEVTP